jgi:flap endonuclease-1
MGINLKDVIFAKQIEIENLSGKRIGIDALNWCYQFLSIIRDRFTGEPLRDSKGRITSHLSGLFYRTVKLIENDIEPVYVFDGEHPKFKEGVVEERIKIRKEAEVKWKQALKVGDTEKVRIYSQAAIKLTDEMIDESKKLLDFMGISWIQAPSEGEAQCAYMCKNNQLYSVASQDFDSLIFGSPKLIRNLSITGRRKLPKKETYITIKPELIELEKVLSDIGINHDQLIILAILIGTDYNPGGIKGIGPKTALKIVKEKKTLDSVLASVKWEFDVNPEQIFDFFKNPPVEDLEIKKQNMEPEKIIELLTEEHDFSKERIQDVVNKLIKREEEGKQLRLGKFFG